MLVSVLACSLVLGWLLPSRYASFTAAAFVAGLVVLLVELGGTIRLNTRSGRGTRSESSLLRRAGTAAVTASLVALLSVGLALDSGGGPSPGAIGDAGALSVRRTL